MYTTTMATVPGESIERTLGVAKGNTVRARNVGRDITQQLRNLFGGELKSYSNLMSEARDESLERMKVQAIEMDADAVVNVRFDTSAVARSSAEMLAYGTAVRLE
ncbi:YbjQ family protein [Halobaculum sp. MBLA0147]|uniref:YbjQ family protein n=1 Tax=Halobaculum sp. MBLA0147 TaxID=3079934 RepID=UPI003523CC11